MTKKDGKLEGADKLAAIDAAILGLTPDDDAHWIQDGRPDLNVLKERVGTNVSRADVDAAGHRNTRRENIADLIAARSTEAKDDSEADSEADALPAPEPEAPEAPAAEEDGDEERNAPLELGRDETAALAQTLGADPAKWAEILAGQLAKMSPTTDLTGFLLGWFSNAIGQGYLKGRHDAQEEAAQAAPPVVVQSPDGVQRSQELVTVVQKSQRLIDLLDEAALLMTPEVRQRQPEVGMVMQSYAAAKPAILEMHKRLQARENAGG